MPSPTQRRRLRVTGTVQGVGFRPFVYRQATDLELVGFVLNDRAGVLLEVEGPVDRLEELGRRIVEEAPPLARVTSVAVSVIPATGGDHGFAIAESADSGPAAAPVSVDTATCAECLAEVDDPADRRYGYPFTNCTNCGPRYTIILGVPYDRPATTMAGFAMCADCQREYDDPADRRFHAQPNACPVCGPKLYWRQSDGRALAEGPAALQAAINALGGGAIIAIKGVGGFHLATDATDEAAVAELRRRKARDNKPFAVMVADVGVARELCHLDQAALDALTCIRRPIVLAPRRSSSVSAGVAPGLPELGLLLPYTPLHHLLMAGAGRPLVMTSGNLSDDPIAHTDTDALSRLGPLIDGLLTHDRPIHIRCDDSVVRRLSDGVQVLRRSRGYAPEPMPLAGASRRRVLAVGAELKNTIAVAKDGWVVASHHIGDLEHLATYQSFRQALDHLPRLYGVAPEVIAHDLHPEYLSTKYALELDLPPWGIQHHHAHIASCLAEHGRVGPVLGLAFDGLGFGPDGTLWGGEFLLVSLAQCWRVGHLLPVPMPGGSAAIREPWRMAVSWAVASVGADRAARLTGVLDERTPALIDLVSRGQGLLTTSVGRLFDAVAALVGVRGRISYEGQAAIELEAAASRVVGAAPYPVQLEWGAGVVLDPRPLVGAVISAMGKGENGASVAASFHAGLAAGAVEAAIGLARRHHMDTVALSGGVFQNQLLSGLITAGLSAAGLEVLTHRHVPANDGGISIGQAAIASTAETLPIVSL